MRPLNKRTMSVATILALLILVALPAFAHAQRGDDERGRGRNDGMRERMHDRMGERLDRMADLLDLTTDQRVLMETMKVKSEAYFMESAECRRGIHRNIMDELKKDKPNLATVAKNLKGDPVRKSTAAYNEMVDSTIAFFGSLTAEQRTLLNRRGMGPDERGGGDFRRDRRGSYNEGKERGR